MIASPDPMPATFDPGLYRSLWPDLTALGDGALKRHFEQFGISEGRQANHLATRQGFALLISREVDALEIGPYYSPLLSGPYVKYFDVLTKEQLIARALRSSKNAERVPHIDYVSPVGDLSIIDRHFNNILSSHCIEHQPDLIRHLKQVSSLLHPGGRYFLLIPDKRYCFDALLHESTIADIVDAHCRGMRVHSLKSVIEHRALTTHNAAKRHWAGDHGTVAGTDRIVAAIDEYNKSDSGYIDVHAWCFTPESLFGILSHLFELKYIDFIIERLYPTRRNANEFWMILKKEETSP